MTSCGLDAVSFLSGALLGAGVTGLAVHAYWRAFFDAYRERKAENAKQHNRSAVS